MKKVVEATKDILSHDAFPVDCHTLRRGKCNHSFERGYERSPNCFDYKHLQHLCNLLCSLAIPIIPLHTAPK